MNSSSETPKKISKQNAKEASSTISKKSFNKKVEIYDNFEEESDEDEDDIPLSKLRLRKKVNKTEGN